MMFHGLLATNQDCEKKKIVFPGLLTKQKDRSDIRN